MSEEFATPEQTVLTDVGPCLHEGGVTYRVWAQGRSTVMAKVEKPGRAPYDLALQPVKDSGYFFGTDPQGAAGDLYKYAIDGAEPVPDFVSHYQPHGVFGPSMVIDAAKYEWKSANWQRPVWSGLVIYEIHLGTFTAGGTYREAATRLNHLVELGVTAVEVMPVCDFAGQRNWGYDGVMLFAPTSAYGMPDDFRAFVDDCHAHGLAVILDIVYNHLGPEGNFSHQFSDYFFHEGKDNPWGQNFNLDGPNSAPVRALLKQNMRYWLDEFRIDGFRMDATHMIHDPSPVHVLAEIAEIVHSRGGFIVAEDDRNARSILEPRDKKGWGFNAVWSDDFHHSARVSLTGEQEYFLSMFSGTAEEIAQILKRAWLYSGQFSKFHGEMRGTPADDLPPEHFVFCISNHDQVGNRWLGERLHAATDLAAYRAMSLFLCLVPYTPLIFMGQEWGASTPFHYFTHMSDELGAKILEGRGQEFLKMEFVKDPVELNKMPNPQAEQTFVDSKLNWDELAEGEHAHLYALYRAGLKLRRDLFGRSNPTRENWQVEGQNDEVIIRYRLAGRGVAVHLRLKATNPPLMTPGQVLLRSNDAKFADEKVQPGAETVIILES